MKITSKILSLPPYLSTTWQNVTSLHVRREENLFTLVVLLQNRTQVEVPNLNKETIDEIFEAHFRSSEDILPKKEQEPPFSFSAPFIKGEGGIANLSSSMEHNPEQKDLPEIPQEVLNKVNMVVRAFGMEDFSDFSDAKPDCNCVYCQIARAMNQNIKSSIDEEVSEEDLSFRSPWDIKQIDKNLYRVTNTLDKNESYNVFLGKPLGCTCGSKECEHIQTVLNS